MESGTQWSGSQFAAIVNLNHPAPYIHWGWLQISLPNFILILVMLAAFVLALVLPFPRGRRR
ncbi:MAG TPA: hypothetical protein VKJ83_09740 [Actinomycetota bacterium]|nr:hypothetical protein [Actinomycetota bacterium]